MPIGTLIPGQPTEVSADASPVLYTTVEGPAPDGPVVATDVLSALLVSLNIQKFIYDKLFTTFALWAFGPLTNGSAVSFDVSVSATWTEVAYQDFSPVTTKQDDFVEIVAGPIVAHCASLGYIAIGFSNDGGATWAQVEQVPVLGGDGASGWTMQSNYQVANSDGTLRAALLVKASATDHIVGNGFGTALKRWASFKVWRQV